MPPGSRIAMSEKSAYVNADIFLDWLKTHLFPKKPPGKMLLILDGHSAHTTNLETLQFAEEHEIILFCLPPHTTHYLQPLDRSFFKSLKSYFYEGCRYFVKGQPNKKLNRLQFGKLLGEAWGKSANVQNAVSGFKSTGIMPFNPRAIPEHAFLLEDNIVAEGTTGESIQQRDSQESGFSVGQSILGQIVSPDPDLFFEESDLDPAVLLGQQTPFAEAGPSGMQNLQNTTPKKSALLNNITPGKALNLISPVPIITPAVKRVCRQLATGVLSSKKGSTKPKKKR